MTKRYINLTAAAAMIVLSAIAAAAQSTDAAFPTNVSTNEIDGVIKARDIGDPRLTSYYYAVGGGQGDLFINVVSKNFAGDIDVFAAEGLRPLTKMVIFADSESSETGRLIYLRKEEKLILRVQGRTPNDDPATFRIKFGGSFIALAPNEQGQTPKVAQVQPNESGVVVNSVGTIVRVIPKPTPAPRPPADSLAKTRPSPSPAPEEASTPETPKVTVSENIPPAPKSQPKRPKDTRRSKSGAAEPATVFGNKRTNRPAPAKPTKRTAAAKAAPAPKKAPVEVEKKPDPLASIRLVVLLKTGESIERPMNEVQKFSVDKGVLTVIATDGTTVRYQILDVAKVTIE